MLVSKKIIVNEIFSQKKLLLLLSKTCFGFTYLKPKHVFASKNNNNSKNNEVINCKKETINQSYLP